MFSSSDEESMRQRKYSHYQVSMRVSSQSCVARSAVPSFAAFTILPAVLNYRTLSCRQEDDTPVPARAQVVLVVNSTQRASPILLPCEFILPGLNLQEANRRVWHRSQSEGSHRLTNAVTTVEPHVSDSATETPRQQHPKAWSAFLSKIMATPPAMLPFNSSQEAFPLDSKYGEP